MSKETSPPKYEIHAVASALRVIEFLFTGDILAYRSLQEIASGAGVSPNTAFRILKTLIASQWAEQSPKNQGFRLSTDGLIQHLVYAQTYLARLSKKYGLKFTADLPS